MWICQISTVKGALLWHKKFELAFFFPLRNDDLEIEFLALFATKLFIDVGVWLNCFGIVYMSRVILCHIEPTEYVIVIFKRCFNVA